jgi:hypothetical protein
MGPGLGVERYQLGVLDAPAAVELLDDQLAVQEHLNLTRPKLAGQGEGAQHRRVFGDVVRLDAQVFRDRGDRSGVGAARRRAGGFDQNGAARRRPGIAPSRAVGADDEPEVGRFGLPLGRAD